MVENRRCNNRMPQFAVWVFKILNVMENRLTRLNAGGGRLLLTGTTPKRNIYAMLYKLLQQRNQA